MIILIVTFLSFFLEFFFNSIFYNTILFPLVVFSSFILLEPFFKKSEDKYLIYSFLIGLLYDIVYAEPYFMNASLFLIIGILVIYINKNTPNSFFVSIFELIILILVYRILGFCFLGLMGVVEVSFDVFLKSIYSSIIFNFIYGIILYLILYFISKKFKIKRIN